ncbi:MAG TPA: hypothetical protein VD993_09445 [Chitinophagaceae bacterium]|nr:hypothetical protein [Chitinophagaceae bacterium]
MIKELNLKANLAQVGEEVGLELGTQMVKNYRQANPTDVQWYLIGREIIEKILAQPGCVGLKFYNAYNEVGEKTLVYVGIDQNGKGILEYSVVTAEGQLNKEKGIVADRIRQGVRTDEATGIDDFEWTTD